ncbi:WD40 repeat domain-containing protein [Dactylosporangium sp. CA-092794]|uniref:WD40 repeat domain-containing protein n=1 Tax=Dactylosporangium sp. CA-092794 TaxID=3239929 RepID=UPI003D8BBE60
MRLISASDQDVRFWDLATGAELTRSSRYPGINGIAAFTVGERVVVAIATERGLSWWDPDVTEAPYPDSNVGTLWGVTIASISGQPAGVFGAAQLDPYPVCRWDPRSGRPQDPIGHHSECVKDVTAGIVLNRPIVVSGDDGGLVRRWDLLAGSEFGRPLGGPEPVFSLALLSTVNDGAIIVSADRASIIQRWDAITGERIGTQYGAHDGGIIALAAIPLPDGPQLLSTGFDGVVRRWDGETGALVDAVGNGYAATAITSDDAVLVAFGDDQISVREIDQS